MNYIQEDWKPGKCMYKMLVKLKFPFQKVFLKSLIDIRIRIFSFFKKCWFECLSKILEMLFEMEILIWRANAFWNGNFNLTSILECNSWKSVTIFPKIQWWHVHFVLDYEDPHPRSWKLVDLITSMKRKEYAPLRWNWLQAYKNQILNIFLKQDRYALANLSATP